MWEGGWDGGWGGCGSDIGGGDGEDGMERVGGGRCWRAVWRVGLSTVYGVEAIQMQTGVSIVHSPHAPIVFHPLFHAMQCLAMVLASRLFLFGESRFRQSMSIKSFSVRV